jgi:polyphosphate kinase
MIKNTKERGPLINSRLRIQRPQDFLNRETGWLNFNLRVLGEVMDKRNPLLERVRFLSISDSNLDEFFMKRVGGLKTQVAYKVKSKSIDGKLPTEQLREIRNHVLKMTHLQSKCLTESLIPELKQNGISFVNYHDITEKEKTEVIKYYRKNIYPILTPLSVDSGHPFPFISNLSISLAVALASPQSDEKLFARIKIPKTFPAWIPLKSPSKQPIALKSMRAKKQTENIRFLSVIEIIQNNLADLFPHLQVLNSMAFRVTRNADVSQDTDDAEDLLQMVADELKQRKFADIVRIEHGKDFDPWLLTFLTTELNLHDDDVYETEGLLDYCDLTEIINLDLPHLKFPCHTPVIPSAFLDKSKSIFDLLKENDYLIHTPFESFTDTVEKFILTAAEDPKVLAIKMTLYRTGDNSQLVNYLIHAAEKGKQVVCLIELKARFDEQRNINLAQTLEDVGIHVVYGIVGLKTHSKTTLVVRQEKKGLKCYAHIGTGNYNATTARLYTDLSLMTSSDSITSDILEFFNYLTGRSLKQNYNNLLVAPLNMFEKFMYMIQRESENASQGRPARIIAKFNSLEESDISMALYKASNSGVKIDLIVRGFCCLRPGVKGLSENITVTSIIGRFLEHSRMFYFRNAARNPDEGEFYIGSADWMYRNLHARVEAIVPIFNPVLKKKCWNILNMCIRDKRQSWAMDSEGHYHKGKSNQTGVQENLIKLTLKHLL